MPLYPCPACQRHVKANEASCPFCAEALPRRRSSPGLVAGALGAAVALTGCPDRAVVKYGAPPLPETPVPPADGDAATADDSPALEPATPDDSAGEPATPDDEPRAVAEYGAPPPRFEEPVEPAEPERAAPKYGAPPPPRELKTPDSEPQPDEGPR